MRAQKRVRRLPVASLSFGTAAQRAFRAGATARCLFGQPHVQECSRLHTRRTLCDPRGGDWNVAINNPTFTGSCSDRSLDWQRLCMCGTGGASARACTVHATADHRATPCSSAGKGPECRDRARARARFGDPPKELRPRTLFGPIPCQR